MSTCAHAFSTTAKSNEMAFYSGLDTKLYSDAAPSDVDSVNIDNSYMEGSSTKAEREQLKTKLLKLCASYDRGFGASPKSRKEVEEIINQLGDMNPTPMDAARGIDGESTSDMGDVPLKGAWRMIWTTALDVLNLAASPVASPGAIYQVIDPPIATNIIDFIPRFQSLLPTAFPSSLVRAEVKTRASLRRNNSNRVGLNFEAVKLYPVEVLGMKSDGVPPFNVNLPKIKIEDLPGVDPNNAPGFFDVVYLDGDMLIIKQNAPGGYFVSIKVDNYDP
jgi:PAP_fibrillin.